MLTLAEPSAAGREPLEESRRLCVVASAARSDLAIGLFALMDTMEMLKRSTPLRCVSRAVRRPPDE